MITGNATLPTCEAERLRDRFVPAATGATIADNDEQGICPVL
jgi:hypothetical protein